MAAPLFGSCQRDSRRVLLGSLGSAYTPLDKKSVSKSPDVKPWAKLRTDSIIRIVIPIIQLKVPGLIYQSVQIIDLAPSPDRVRAVDVRELVNDAEELVREGGFVVRILYLVQTSCVIHRWAVHAWVWERWVREESGAE